VEGEIQRALALSSDFPLVSIPMLFNLIYSVIRGRPGLRGEKGRQRAGMRGTQRAPTDNIASNFHIVLYSVQVYFLGAADCVCAMADSFYTTINAVDNQRSI
jgi:hypothetical protein